MAKNDEWHARRQREAQECQRVTALLDLAEVLLGRLAAMTGVLGLLVVDLAFPGYRLNIWLSGTVVLGLVWVVLDKWRWRLHSRKYDLYESLGYRN